MYTYTCVYIKYIGLCSYVQLYFIITDYRQIIPL